MKNTHMFSPLADTGYYTWIFFICLCACVSSWSCSSLPTEALDPPLTDTLKQRITKARNAIKETRRTMTRAQGSSYLQELTIRLAELLSDEARAHYQVARAREGVTNKSLHVPQVKTLKQKSINVYQEFLNRYPSSSLVSRALFNMGQEYRELGEYDKMRETFERLVSEKPRDPLTSEALLVLGGDYFDRNQLDEAKKRFQKMIDSPPHKSRGLAYYKLAWVQVNQDQCKEAISSFKSAIQETQRWLERAQQATNSSGGETSGGGAGIDVRREALVDMMFCYSKEHPEKGAVDNIKALAYDRGPLITALEKLGRRYSILERLKGLRDVSRALLDLAPGGPRRLEDAQLLHGSLVKLKDYREVGADVHRITTTIRRAISSPQIEESAREQLLSEYERYARDLGTKAQDEFEKRYVKRGGAVNRRLDPKKQGKQEKKSVPLTPQEIKDAEEIAVAYVNYLNTFSEAESYLDILSNLAQVYSDLGHNFKAARRYYERSTSSQIDRLKKSSNTKLTLGDVKETTQSKGENKEKTEIKEIDPREEKEIQLQSAYQAIIYFQKALNEEGHSQADRVVARAALRRAAARLLTSPLSKDQGPQVRFAIAQTFYDEGRLDEAIEYLSAVATEYPNTLQGDSSALLILDAYKQKNDFLGLALSGERLIKAGLNASLQPRVKKLIKQARQQELDELALEASGVDGGDVTAELLEFAEASANTPLGERALLNAFVAARATGELDAMSRISQLIVSQYPKSKQLIGVFSSLARSAAEQLEISGAQEAFKQAASRAPQQKIALLSASAELSARLGDIEGALSTLKSALTKVTPEGKIGLALYANLLVRYRPKSAAWSSLSRFKSDATPELSAALGYLQVLKGQFDEAEETLQAVIEAGDLLASNPHAMGLFAMAEVNTHYLKSFKPEQTVDEIAEWVTLMELAEQSYLKVARVGHPLWGSAALNRLASLSRYGSAEILKFKAPKDLDAQSQKRFETGFKKRSQSLAKQAEQALKACRGLGFKKGIFPIPVRFCLRGELIPSAEIKQEAYLPRGTVAGRDIGKSDREAFARNPQDFKAAYRLGKALLEANDPHLARLALSQALQGGGPEILNLYGIACARINDWTGAFEGFGRASVAGLEAGIENIKKLFNKLNMSQAQQQADETWSVQITGGERW